MSLSGKSWSVKRTLPGLVKAGVPVLAYSGVQDDDLRKVSKAYTQYVDEFETILEAWRGRRSFVVIDEAPILFDQISPGSHPLTYNLAASGRHAGFSVRIISQSPTRLPPFVRDNLHSLDVFCLQNEDQSKAIVGDRGISRKWAEVIRTLKPLEYLAIRPGVEPVKRRL